MAAHWLDHGAQPDVVVQIRRDQAEHFELEPASPVNYRHEPDRENRARAQAIDSVLADRHGSKSEQKRQPSHDLRVVAQRVRHHHPRDGE